MYNRTNPVSATTLFACKKYEEMKSNPPSKTVRKCESELSPEFDITTYAQKHVKVCKDVEVIDHDAVTKAKENCEAEKSYLHRP